MLLAGVEVSGLKDLNRSCVIEYRNPASNPASNIPHPVSRIQYPASRIPHPVSRIQYPASRILPSLSLRQAGQYPASYLRCTSVGRPASPVID
jgi:hypothetical protein